MLGSVLTAVAVTVALTTLWASVQTARRRAFPQTAVESDLLGEPGSCGACPQRADCETNERPHTKRGRQT